MDHEQQFHDVVIYRRAGRLHHEDIRSAHVLLDLDIVFAVREGFYLRFAQGHARGSGKSRRPSERLALPLKILMRSGFIARIGFGAAIGSGSHVLAAVDATRRDNAPGLRTEWEKLASSFIRSMARAVCAPVAKSPKTAEPLPVIIAGLAPSLNSAAATLSTEGTALEDDCLEIVNARRRIPVPVSARPNVHTADWKLTILFCWDSIVKRGLSRQVGVGGRNMHSPEPLECRCERRHRAADTVRCRGPRRPPFHR